MIQKHLTWWEDHNISRPTKRYVVIFNTFRDHLETRDITEFNTEEEALEEARLINIYYQDTPKPYREQTEDSYHWNKKYKWVYPSPESRWWGYLVLDMEAAKLLKVGGSGMYISYLHTLGKKEFDLWWTDRFFRDPTEIPEDYVWDEPEEFDGWLQYRWGDGKNGLTYQEPSKPKKEDRHGDLEWDEVWSEALGRYVTVIKRVMIIPWDSELPEKRQKGVIYWRPNGEPVLWPGEFGYEDDYNIQPWSLEEEMAENLLDNRENKTASNTIGDALDLLSPSGLNLALELDKYRRENEMDDSNNTSTDSV